MLKAYITGATGCVGRNLIDILLKDGWQIIVLHRPNSNLSSLTGYNVSFREVDFTNYNSVCEAITDKVDAIFHIGANLSHDPRDSVDQIVDNYIGTRNLISRCSTAKITKRFIHCSTGATGYCESLNIKESLKQYPGYVGSKKAAEIAIQELLESDSEFDAVILRPIIVVGKYDTNNYSQFFSMIRDGKLPFSIPGTLEFCNAGDVAKAHLSAFHNGLRGDIYWLGGEFLSWHEFFVRIAVLLNVKPPRKSPPIFVWKVLSHLIFTWSRITKSPVTITPDLIRLLGDGQPLNIDAVEKSKHVLGYVSKPLDHSLLECFEWMRQNEKGGQ